MSVNEDSPGGITDLRFMRARQCVGGTCVEVAMRPSADPGGVDEVLIRDGKDPKGGVLSLSPDGFAALADAAASGVANVSVEGVTVVRQNDFWSVSGEMKGDLYFDDAEWLAFADGCRSDDFSQERLLGEG